MSEEASLDEFADTEAEIDSKPEAGQELFGLGEIPAEWEIKSLSESAEIIPGNSPPSSTYNENGEGLPFFQGNSEFGHFYPEADTWCSEPRKEAEENDVLMSIRAPVGDLNIADRHCCIGRGLAALRPKSINGLYLFYDLAERQIWLSRLATGSTFKSVTKSDLHHLDVPVPPLEEQRKIATVLYTVDRAIQKTEEIINQLETARRGTEQDLLSRGILEDGSLRGEDGIEYKNSWVGEVPTDWVVQPYSELISDSSVGIVVKPSQYYDDAGKVPILRSKDITRDGVVHGDFEYMTQKSNDENESSQLQTGDVIAVRSGEPGLSCVVSPEFDGANCADLLISTPGPNLDSDYAAMWINSRAGRKQIDRFQAGLAQKHFNLGALRKLRVAVPEIEEQQRIVERVSSMTEALDREKRYKTKLQALKQGLMQDLLSGAVRTHDADIDIPEAVLAHG